MIVIKRKTVRKSYAGSGIVDNIINALTSATAKSLATEAAKSAASEIGKKTAGKVADKIFKDRRRPTEGGSAYLTPRSKEILNRYGLGSPEGIGLSAVPIQDLFKRRQ